MIGASATIDRTLMLLIDTCLAFFARLSQN
jgi:hypothetical protein